MEPLSGAGDGVTGWLLDMGAKAGDMLASDSLAESAATTFKNAEGVAERLPIVGQALSGLQSAYHLGSAGYDAVTGDRDGAVSHLASGLVNAAMVVPGVNEAVGGVDELLGHVGTGGKLAAELAGVDPSIVDVIPTGLDDVAATSSVAAVNTLFGADDSDWIPGLFGAESQDGKGVGTRGGEINFGMMGMNALATGGASLPLDIAMSHMGLAPGQQIANLFGVADNRTSGVEDNLAAKAGQMVHSGEAAKALGL